MLIIFLFILFALVLLAVGARYSVRGSSSVALQLGIILFRRVNKGDNLIGESITPQAIRDIVVSYAEKLKNEGIAPHDLRRTFAKLAHKGGSPNAR